MENKKTIVMSLKEKAKQLKTDVPAVLLAFLCVVWYNENININLKEVSYV